METDTTKVRGLVIAPFDTEGQRLQEIVVSALTEIGVETFRLENLPSGASLANAIMHAIRAADLIFVDVTRYNPNVFYELGYAHGLRRRTILLRSTESPFSALPSDLHGFFYIPYDPANPQRLKEDVQRAAARHAECGVQG